MKKDEKPLEGLISNIIKDLAKPGRIHEEEMLMCWREAVGEGIAKHARPVSLKKAVLTVNVDGSGWLYELTLKKREVLKKLESVFKNGKIKDIKLRIGDIKEETKNKTTKERNRDEDQR